MPLTKEKSISSVGSLLLAELLKKAQKTPHRKLGLYQKLHSQSIGLDGEVYPFKVASVNKELHEYLEDAEREGIITIVWESGLHQSVIEKIKMVDHRKLAHYLGQDYLPDQIASLAGQVVFIPQEHWLNEVVAEVWGAWSCFKSKYRLETGDILKLNLAVKAILALESKLLKETPMDFRQFGARILGDSKATDRIVGVVSTLLKKQYGIEGIYGKDVLIQFNLTPMNHPVLVSGPITFGEAANKPSSLSGSVRPYVGVPPVLLSGWSVEHSPEYVLTIENLSSFLEYTETINDNAIIVYTAGYPTTSLQRFYRELNSAIDAPLYHWGDTDPHGFIILKTLQRNTDQPVTPHLMDESVSEGGLSVKKEAYSAVGSIAPITDDLVKLYANGERAAYEQETIPARRPFGVAE